MSAFTKQMQFSWLYIFKDLRCTGTLNILHRSRPALKPVRRVLFSPLKAANCKGTVPSLPLFCLRPCHFPHFCTAADVDIKSKEFISKQKLEKDQEISMRFRKKFSGNIKTRIRKLILKETFKQIFNITRRLPCLI